VPDNLTKTFFVSHSDFTFYAIDESIGVKDLLKDSHTFWICNFLGVLLHRLMITL